MHLLVVTALLWQTSGKTISHKSRFPPQLIEKEDLTKALHLHPCWQEGRESKILPKHEHTLTDAGYLYFTKANKNKLLFKHSTGNEIGFTSCEQSVSVKAISGGGKKKKVRLVSILMQSLASCWDCVQGERSVPIATRKATSSFYVGHKAAFTCDYHQSNNFHLLDCTKYTSAETERIF